MSSSAITSVFKALFAGAATITILLICRFISSDFRWIVVAAVVVGLLSSCALYNQEWKLDPPSQEEKYDLRVVQVDDFGSFWNPERARTVADEIDAWSKVENVVVVVFIHGWHNNAQPDNDNLVNFKKSLSRLADLMDEPAYIDARERLTRQRSYRLVGVYVGWRGKSLPMPLDYATAWWRKDAAERVGDGDVAEFLERLQRSYLRANSTDAYAGSPIEKQFMGLITIGHSFGGQVLLKAIARPIESDLIVRTAGNMADTANPPGAITRPPPVEVKPIDSYGDVNILLNPALEAYQFARIDSLYRDLSYTSNQTPQLLVFSADDDWARQTFFPIERLLTSPFRPAFKTSYQGQLWGKALGELQEQQTHDLNLATGTPDSLSAQDYLNPGKVMNYDFTGPTTFSGVALVPRGKPGIANSPVAVIYTHQDIIKQHSGIFGDSLREFLVHYVAFLEGKRMLLRQQQLEKSLQAALVSKKVSD